MFHSNVCLCKVVFLSYACIHLEVLTQYVEACVTNPYHATAICRRVQEIKIGHALWMRGIELLFLLSEKF